MQCKTSRLTFNLALAGIRLAFIPNYHINCVNRTLNNISKRHFAKSESTLSFDFSNNSVCFKMNPSALVLLADGAEELEFVTIVDVLRRGQVKVIVGGVCGTEPVKCSNSTVICPDKSIKEASLDAPYSAIVLPGGLGGSKLLSESEEVGKLLRTQENSDGVIAAICAAPTALKAHGIGKGKLITSYPAMADILKKDGIYKYKDDCPVVVDGKLITSRGPATALIFAFTILEELRGKDKAKEVASAMLYHY